MKYLSYTSVWLCVLCLMFVSRVMALTCPYTHLNCVCKNTTVTCSNLQTIPDLNRENDVVAVDTLQFLQGEITSVPDSSLPSGLVEILFRDNPLTNISDNAFDNSSTTLKSLTIMNVTLNRIPNAFSKLTSLETLTLRAIDIKDWNSPVLQNIVDTLQTLSLIAINLTVWPSWISDCHSLSRIYINTATLRTIPDDAFVSMNKTLTFFAVRNTGLTQIPAALSSLRNLTTLDIYGGHLDNFNGREGFEQVTTFPCASTLVTLTGNLLYLKSLPNLSALTSVTYLDLSFNEIPQVTSDMLPRGLEKLYLSNIAITKLADTSFANLSRLEILYLYSNPITEISRNAFRDLVSLKTLHLYYTSLTQIPLALVTLSSLNSVYMVGLRALQCPCPIVDTELQLWYASYNHTLEVTGVCCNQRTITSYLNGSCQQQLPADHTCPSDSAAWLAPGLWLCFLLLLFQILVCF